MIVLKVLSTTRKIKMEYVDQKEETNEGRTQSAMMVTDTKNHSLKILTYGKGNNEKKHKTTGEVEEQAGQLSHLYTSFYTCGFVPKFKDHIKKIHGPSS